MSLPGENPEDPALPEEAIPMALPLVAEESGGESGPPEPVPLAVPIGQDEPAAPSLCPFCQAPRQGGLSYCADCGLVFPMEEAPTPASAETAPVRLKGRYEPGEVTGRRGDSAWFRGLDHGAGHEQPGPVVLLRSPASEPAVAEIVAAAADPSAEEDVLSGFDLPDALALPATGIFVAKPTWPSVGWMDPALERAGHPGLPRVLDRFTEGGAEYLVIEAPQGRPFWDAWDDPDATADRRFGWLEQVADMLRHLHLAGAVVEELRPEKLVVTADDRSRLTDPSDLLPLPMLPNLQLRGSPYTAPELVLSPESADARADLYAFGTLIFALHLGRELTELDFEREGVPKPFASLFPDAHPLLARLVAKTICREVASRFPTEEAAAEDPTGFAELLRTLANCRRSLDLVRLDVAAWTTTGMVRSSNEDAFTFRHTAEACHDELGETALVVLADGMGGSEAGEVAATLAVRVIREHLLARPGLASLKGGVDPKLAAFDPEECGRHVRDALEEANRQVREAAHDGRGRPGMGCTAEVVLVQGRHVVVGHVGDSRTYHQHAGRLTQVTRDHTLVNRLLELGTITSSEAEGHPRRSELQQAVGGRGGIDPAVHHAILCPGDWIVVCSDGLSNHVSPPELQQMLQGEATSAETAARRLVNFANLKGAADNATVVVIRAT